MRGRGIRIESLRPFGNIRCKPTLARFPVLSGHWQLFSSSLSLPTTTKDPSPYNSVLCTAIEDLELCSLLIRTFSWLPGICPVADSPLLFVRRVGQKRSTTETYTHQPVPPSFLNFQPPPQRELFPSLDQSCFKIRRHQILSASPFTCSSFLFFCTLSYRIAFFRLFGRSIPVLIDILPEDILSAGSTTLFVLQISTINSGSA